MNLDAIADYYNADTARIVDGEVHTRTDGPWIYRCDVGELPVLTHVRTTSNVDVYYVSCATEAEALLQGPIHISHRVLGWEDAVIFAAHYQNHTLCYYEDEDGDGHLVSARPPEGVDVLASL
jgi:hypothetical protein